MPRFKLTIEYAGTRYSGWQKQTNARTVQGELERAIVAGLGEVLVDSQGSGRTDAGVHALAQVAHVDLVRAPAPEQLRRRINDELPADIHVLDAAAVSRKFHARHSAVRRSYVYQVVPPPHRRLPSRTCGGSRTRSTWRRMQAVAAGFVGRHDFRAFSDDDPDEKSTVVVLDEVTVAEAGPLLLVRVAGSHFLWKMVRRMVGVLVAAGTGALPPARIDDWLTSPGCAGAAASRPRLTAPAAGLFLERVFYERRNVARAASAADRPPLAFFDASRRSPDGVRRVGRLLRAASQAELKLRPTRNRKRSDMERPVSIAR